MKPPRCSPSHFVRGHSPPRKFRMLAAATLLAARISNHAGEASSAKNLESRFTLPEGFALRLVAAEPDIANPMTMCVDEQGAIYVSEAHTYRYGPKESAFQPPSNPIKRIVPGPDGSGARITVVAEGFPDPVMGLHASGGKLYGTCLNDLFVMDIGSDGRGTNRRTLVKDAASPWNPFGMYRVRVGPDDRLWLCIADHPGSEPVALTGTDGSTVCMAGQSGGMARCRRDGSDLEVMVQGFRAPFAFDIDPWGHLWHISNGEGSPNIYVHVIPGMDYGYHSREVSYAWMAGKTPFAPPARDMGAGANTAALHYFDAMFPAEFRGNVFVANWGSHGANPGNRVIRRFLRRNDDGTDDTGSAGTGLTECDAPFLTSSDPAFRPTCLVPAPDGGLYLSDWHGRDDENDKTGRILKITHRAAPAASSPVAETIAAMKPDELTALLGHPNGLTRELAMRALCRTGEAALEPLRRVLGSGEPFAAAHAVWTLTRMAPEAAAPALMHGFKNPDARVRAHALREFRRLPRRDSPAAAAAPLLADPDGEVRVEAALAQDSPAAVGKGLLAALEAARSPRLRYQIGFELARRGEAAALEALHSSSNPEWRRVAMIAAETARHWKTALAAVVSGWEPDSELSHRGGQLAAQALRGEIRLTETSDQLQALEWLEEHPPAAPVNDFLLSCLRDEDRLVQAAALRLVRRTAADSPEITTATLRLLQTERPQPVQLEALYTLGSLADAGRPEVWLPWLKQPDPVVAVAALRALRQRERKPDFTRALWPAACESATRHPRIGEEARFTFHQLGLPEDKLVAPPDLAGRNQQTPAVLARMKEASPVLGQLSFTAARTMCVVCHSEQPGNTRLGPSLAGIGAAATPEYLIESVLDPGAVLKTGFQMETIETHDGRTFSGLVEAAGDTLLIRTLGTAPVKVPQSTVKCRTASQASLMPAGLDTLMSVCELADLTAYLLTLKHAN